MIKQQYCFGASNIKGAVRSGQPWGGTEGVGTDRSNRLISTRPSPVLSARVCHVFILPPPSLPSYSALPVRQWAHHGRPAC